VEDHPKDPLGLCVSQGCEWQYQAAYGNQQAMEQATWATQWGQYGPATFQAGAVAMAPFVIAPAAQAVIPELPGAAVAVKDAAVGFVTDTAHKWFIGAGLTAGNWLRANTENLYDVTRDVIDFLIESPTSSGMSNPERGAVVLGRGRSRPANPKRLVENEVTTFQEFRRRSIIGDKLEGHELLQHSVLKQEGLATERLSTEASKKHPIIALSRRTHRTVNKLQTAAGTARMPAAQGIKENANIIRTVGVPTARVDEAERQALEHAKSLGLVPE
jgi:hypothetical protein